MKPIQKIKVLLKTAPDEVHYCQFCTKDPHYGLYHCALWTKKTYADGRLDEPCKKKDYKKCPLNNAEGLALTTKIDALEETGREL